MVDAQHGPGRIGVFGSAFNPPHLGHVDLLDVAMKQLCLDYVAVVPTGEPYHKDVGDGPGKEVRWSLAQAAFGGIDDVDVSRIEVDRDGPSFTCDTLEEIESFFPDSGIHLLMGADTARGFAGWHRPERILELASVAVAPRAEVDRQEVQAVFAGLGAGDRLRFLEMPEIAISSSQVRALIANGDEYRQLVPEPVAKIIDNEDLYGQSK